MSTASIDTGTLVNRLRELVEIETPSGDVAAIERFVGILQGQWAGLGATATLLASQNGPHLRFDLPGSGSLGERPPVVFVGHSDTVRPLGTLATMPFHIDGDKITGPGCLDMRSGLVIMQAAVAAVLDAPERRTVRVIVVSDEEIGSPTAGQAIAEAIEGAGLVLGFEAPHPDGGFKSGRWGSTRVRVDVEGRAAHAALDPEKGINAIDELIDQIAAVKAVAAPHIKGGDMLLNVGTISGGTGANVVAERASVIFGFRFRTAEAESTILGALAAPEPVREGAVVTTTVLSQRAAWNGDDATSVEAAAAVLAVCERLGQPSTAREARGAGDANQTGAAGVPTLDGLGPRGAGAHAVTEHCFLSSIGERIELVTAILTDETLPL